MTEAEILSSNGLAESLKACVCLITLGKTASLWPFHRRLRCFAKLAAIGKNPLVAKCPPRGLDPVRSEPGS